ncbi:L-lysine-aminomutase [Xylaria arbuscula]|nr:L-lysine-aminomutase [Xylaria arbuscula]
MFSRTMHSPRLLPLRMMPSITRSYSLSLNTPRIPPYSFPPRRSTLEPPGASTASIGAPQVPFRPDLQEAEFWRELAPFRNISRDDFLSWDWNRKNVVETWKTRQGLLEFFGAVVPDEVPRLTGIGGMQTRDEFCTDVVDGIKESTMSVRVMPLVLTRINWSDPANCPIFRQFIPLKSIMVDDHLQLELDSLHEQKDSPVKAIVHRYPDKALFLPTSVCPTFCLFCTRSYGVGASTDSVHKVGFKLSRSRIDEAFEYIRSQDQLRDVVVSGGDAYYLPDQYELFGFAVSLLHPNAPYITPQPPENNVLHSNSTNMRDSRSVLKEIGDRLISMKNIQRFRIATKGLAVCPNRILDDNDPWTQTLLYIADKARKANKHFAVHTHFNHPNEITWLTEKASRKLHQAGVTVRNQSVLLRGINDDVDTMSSLIQKLASMNIQPYYVYQCDMVPKVEHVRTPLQTILDLESQLRGTIAGFFMPQFVVDCPGGGGKRLACSYDSYDRETGVSTFRAPALKKNGKEGKVYRYYDPLPPKPLPKPKSLPKRFFFDTRAYN